MKSKSNFLSQSSFKLFKVKKLGKVVTGKTPPTKYDEYFGQKIPFLTPSDITDSKFVHKHERKLSSKGKILLQKYVLPPGSVAVSCIGSDMGKTVMIQEPTITNQQFNSIIPNDNVNSEYLYYYFTNFKNNLKILASGGTALPIINKSSFEEIELSLPPKPIQTIIVQILSPLDDLIEHLRLENKVLEKIIFSIFKSWFINFDGQTEFEDSELGKIPKGWTVVNTPDVADVVDCLHSKKPEEQKEGPMILQVFNVGHNGEIILSKKYHVTQEDYNYWIQRIEVEEGDLVITNVGRVGHVAQIPYHLRTAIGRNMTAVRPHRNVIGSTYLLQYFLSEYIEREIEKKYTSGSVLASLNVQNIESLSIMLPTFDIIQKFEKIARPLRFQFERNLAEILTLNNLRTLLLPKLMSGKISV